MRVYITQNEKNMLLFPFNCDFNVYICNVCIRKNWLIAKSVWENVFEIPSTKCDLTFSHIIRHASISKTPPYKDILVPLRQLNCDKRSDNFSILCLT